MKTEEAILKLFVNNRWTLSTAESCTGGSIASKLTRVPGASKYFLGSIVSYSNALKTRLLHVPEPLLHDKGAVSKEVVAAMAEGILSATNSTVSLAVSGIAGPTGGSKEKPIGTIWAAIAQEDQETFTWTFQAHGNREAIIEHTVQVLLTKLLQHLSKE